VKRRIATTIFGLALGVAGTQVGAHAEAPQDRGTTVVASGLNNPRMISVGSDGALYVAEAGVGGSGPCITGAEGEACYGRTGAVTKIAGGKQTRVLSGLPSLAGPGGFGASGPAGIAVSGSTYTLSYGLGAMPSARNDLPGMGRLLGTTVRGSFGSRATTIGDIAAWEGVKDFDGAGPDSNPGGLALSGRTAVVTDAGANAVVRVTPRGKMSLLAVLPSRLVPFGGGQIPMQSVPTAVAVGPDGAFYVSELTGFPFPAKAARIYRVVPGQRATIYASGLTNVTGLTWSRGRLYAVQFADDGLLAVPEGELPMGSLVEVRRDGNHRVVASGLTAPYSVAVRGTDAYVTTCGLCAGLGGVSKVSLGG